MDIEEILARNGKLTDDEVAFLEANLLVMSRQLLQQVQKVSGEARAQAPALAERLERSAASVLLEVESAVNGPKDA